MAAILPRVRNSIAILVGFFTFALIAFSAIGQEASDQVSPEFSSGSTAKQLVKGSTHMVSSANPHASRAGDLILREGGNAIDAMVAIQLVLGLVEPQSSGLGGGAFLVYFDADKNRLTTFDGRETAPLAATPDMFLDDTGQPMYFFDAAIGGRSVATPGTVKLLHEIHQRYGNLAWARLFEPAIELAETGFEVSPRLNALITASAESLFKYPDTRHYFLSEEGVPLYAGTLVRNDAYAGTLKAIATHGADAFYRGPLAQVIVDVVQNAEGNPGLLAMEDLSAYRVIEREPVCLKYRDHDICGMGPPSSGALTVGQILGLLKPYDMASLGPQNPESWRLIGEASRLAFADRGRYMADSDFVKMPKGLLNSDYLLARSKVLGARRALEHREVQPGEPPFNDAALKVDDQSLELPSTSHFSIVDTDGNVVSMTTTIENGFGSRLMAGGFLLNNELTDFSFVSQINGMPVANRLEPGKRPRSSMSPTIVMKDGKPVLAIGSPGGSRIIGYVAKTLIAHLDWGMDIQQAIELPHLLNRFGEFDLEAGTAAESFETALEAMGFVVNIRDLNSGLHGIAISQEGLEGGADPRREGIVLGR